MKHEPDFELIARHLAGETDTDAEKALGQWRAADPKHERAFEELVSVWAETEPPRPEQAFDVVDGWRELSARLEEIPAPLPGTVVEPAKLVFLRRPAFLALAAVLLVGVLGFYLWRGDGGGWREVVTSATQQKTVQLADGSLVRLNAGSHLRWRQNMEGAMREVQFSGQGYFQVARQQRPFVVTTDDARVRVLGTAFEVWARNDRTRVTVRQGRVLLSAMDGADSVILEPNQSARAHAGRITPVETVDAAALLGWVDGRLVFHQQRLEDVLFDLEQVFGVTLRLRQPELADRKVTASFEGADLETVLSEICLALNLDYVSEGQQTTIFEK